ncbi:NADPH-dependent 1-acyl dihydroxyacetone phosphate reductase [Exophiala xenobiotica]|nr:NADPH-dependent 1-acyl dihydroxyacetone phosphate reductase [Exophiala xenobiotica]KAK5362221.1 NADPH-dependent 1-acyl dihydroxyacetone phosphate reductase [Exophiala xenobiotica]KAK5363054.1 NADPH-dependent 1-acyl dihydroxyacetone phosphate reductase [Exophiala xenobiotica]KAK5363878.1 NADPH-dependent 1-acyl dihydroxyacetone phosphate reductase [Exophiala xenobiotica]KAK5392122.1 NADPH-dependent 1-acyl dihydroxyacetone phosphate reductase [Exophiala xenobiotica]
MSTLEKLPNMTLLPLDVTSSSSIAEAVEQVKSRTGGKLDYLLNNSGQNIIMPALDLDIDDAKGMFEVNFWGVLRMIQAFAPLLIEAEGTIVNIGSIVAYLHAPYTSVYNASKAAIDMLDETLRIELAPLNVKVLTVVTGSIKTNIQQNSPKPQLPPTSRYRAAEKYLEKSRNDEIDHGACTPESFAQKVVGDVLGGATGKIWRGTHASTTRYVRYFVPMWLQDSILTKGTDLDKVGKGGS